MPPITSERMDSITRTKQEHYQPADGLITRDQLESAIREFHRREQKWSGTDDLRVLVACNVPIELWNCLSKVLAEDDAYPDVFLEAEFDAEDGDHNGGLKSGAKPVVVDVFIGKVASEIHHEVRKSIIQNLTSNFSIGDNAVLDLAPAPVVIPPSHSTPSQQRSIQKRPDLAIRALTGNNDESCPGPATDEDPSSIRVVIEIEDHHRRPQDSLVDLSDEFFRALPLLHTAAFVRIFRRRVSRRFACVAIVMQRVASSSSSFSDDGSVSGVITDAVSFGSYPLSANPVVSRIRQLTRVSDTRPIPREMEPLAPHDRKFGNLWAKNLWASNPSDPLNRPFITVRATSAVEEERATTTSSSSSAASSSRALSDRDDGGALKIWLWPIYQIAHERIPI